MKCKQVLESLLDKFYNESGGLAWGYIEVVTIGEVCGNDVEQYCLKVKRAAEKRSAKLQQPTNKVRRKAKS